MSKLNQFIKNLKQILVVEAEAVLDVVVVIRQYKLSIILIFHQWMRDGLVGF